MRSTGVWLDVWEAAAVLAPGLREAALLRPAVRDVGPAALMRLPIGVRDGLLLDLRGALFGPDMLCVATCPACGEGCEWTARVDSLKVAASATSQARCDWSGDGWTIRFRPVDSLDLAALRDTHDETTSAQRLLDRCVIEASRDGVSVAPAELPPAIIDAVVAAMAEADPQAALSIELTCPSCAEAWSADFDPGAYLWAELDAWAERTLGEVDQLARAYGWAERDILALSPSRRSRYLATVSS